MKLKINNTTIAVNSEGIPFICLFFLLGFISLSIYGLNFITFLLLFLAIFMLFFFREPERIPNLGINNILSPADGKVVAIEKVQLNKIISCPGEFNDQIFNKISISIGILDSHIQKNPVDAKVIDIKYEEGKFFNTSLDKDHKDSEKNHVFLKKDDKFFMISQISGLISRRISCYIKVNEDIIQGANYGIIKFGSMVNLYIPVNCKILIKNGQTVVAGETILGLIE